MLHSKLERGPLPLRGCVTSFRTVVAKLRHVVYMWVTIADAIAELTSSLDRHDCLRDEGRFAPPNLPHGHRRG